LLLLHHLLSQLVQFFLLLPKFVFCPGYIQQRLHLCVETPPLPVTQEQVLADIALQYGNSNSGKGGREGGRERGREGGGRRQAGESEGVTKEVKGEEKGGRDERKVGERKEGRQKKGKWLEQRREAGRREDQRERRLLSMKQLQMYGDCKLWDVYQ